MTNAITFDPFIELESRFRRTYQLPEFHINSPYYYTRDSALALEIIELLKLTVAYDGMWTARYDLSLLSYTEDMVTAIFNVAIKAYIAEKPEAMLLYGHLSEPTDVDVVTTKYVKRYVLVEHYHYYPAGADDDFHQDFDDLDIALEALRAAVTNSKDVHYIYDKTTGRQYHLKDVR